MRRLLKDGLHPDEFLDLHMSRNCGEIERREVQVNNPPVVHVPFEGDFRVEVYELRCSTHNVSSARYYLQFGFGDRVLFRG